MTKTSLSAVLIVTFEECGSLVARNIKKNKKIKNIMRESASSSSLKKLISLKLRIVNISVKINLTEF